MSDLNVPTGTALSAELSEVDANQPLSMMTHDYL